MSNRGRWETVGTRIFVVALLYLLLYAGTFYGAIDWRGAASLHLVQLAGAFGGAWALFSRDDLGEAIGGGSLLAGTALLLWVCAAPLHAVAPRFALHSSLALPGALGWALLGVATIRSERSRIEAARGCIVATLAICVWSYVAYRQGVTVRPSLPLGHHNFLAGALVMLIGPVAALALARQSGAAERATAALALVAGLMTLAGTSSLSGVIGFGVGCAALFVQWIRIHGDGWRWRRGGIKSIGLALVAGALVFSVTPGGSRVLDRAESIVSGEGDRSLRNRLDYSRGALSGLFNERPVLGFGPGAVPALFPLYRVQRHEAEEIGKVVTQLHGTPAHLLFELGVGGVMIVLLLAATLFRGAAARVRETQDRDRLLRMGALAGLVGYAAASLGDYQLHLGAISALLALLLGIVFGGASRPACAGRTPGSRLLARSAALCLCVTGASGAIRVWAVDRAHRHWDAAVGNTLSREELDAAIQNTLRAAELDPNLGFYQQSLADLLERSGAPASAGTVVPLRLSAARRAPFAPLYAARAGTALLAAERPEVAREWLRLAAALEQASPLTWFHLARADERLGDRRGALRHWSHALALEPVLQGAEEFADSTDRDLGRCLALRLYPPEAILAPGQLGRPESWRPDAVLRTTFDDDRWRSTAAFVFRRKGLPGAGGEVLIDRDCLFGGGIVRPAARFRSVDVLPSLPSRAIELLERGEWAIPPNALAAEW